MKIYGNELTGQEWLEGLSRIKTRNDLPISLQGGEPTLHKEFYKIIEAKAFAPLDLMTNCSFNIYTFMEYVRPWVFMREAPYASIRVSYHPGQQQFDSLLSRVVELQRNGYSIGIWSVDHPLNEECIRRAKEKAEAYGIDFRLKEFLGMYEGKLYGEYKYQGAINGKKKKVLCRTTELLISPDGNIYRCHSDLYAGRGSIGHILDDNFQIEDKYRECNHFGECNPCDVKIKTNRFQIHGHTSVDIKEI